MKELVGMFAAFMESSHPEEVLDCCVVGTVEAEDPKEVLGTLRGTLLDALLDTDEGREQVFVDLGYHYYQSGAPVVNLIAILNFFHQGFIRTLSDVGMLNRYYARINDFFNDISPEAIDAAESTNVCFFQPASKNRATIAARF